MKDIRDEIISELTQAIKHLGAQSDLLACVNSYGDTQSDEDTLEQLKAWNAKAALAPSEVSPTAHGLRGTA